MLYRWRAPHLANQSVTLDLHNCLCNRCYLLNSHQDSHMHHSSPYEAICRPIDPSDIFSLMGVYAGFQPQLPAVPGLEGGPQNTLWCVLSFNAEG